MKMFLLGDTVRELLEWKPRNECGKTLVRRFKGKINNGLEGLRFVSDSLGEDTTSVFIYNNKDKYIGIIKGWIFQNNFAGFCNEEELFDIFLADFLTNPDKGFDPNYSDDPEYDLPAYVGSRLQYFLIDEKRKVLTRMKNDLRIYDEKPQEDDGRLPTYSVNINEIVADDRYDSIDDIVNNDSIDEIIDALEFLSIEYEFNFLRYYLFVFENPEKLPRVTEIDLAVNSKSYYSDIRKFLSSDHPDSYLLLELFKELNKIIPKNIGVLDRLNLAAEACPVNLG